MRADIRRLDDSMQMLVYDNYNKFIAATGAQQPITAAHAEMRETTNGRDSTARDSVV
jgi:hypothetical protein